MTETILVVCDNPAHPRGKPTSVATFSRHQGEPWGVVGDTGARRPSKPGRPLRVSYVLGPHGHLGGKLRCKRCGELVPPISLDILNSLAAQGVSHRTIEELRMLASKQQ